MSSLERCRRYRVATIELFHCAELARLRGDEEEWRRLISLGIRTIAALKRYDDSLQGPHG
jgi:hypothetical protein